MFEAGWIIVSNQRNFLMILIFVVIDNMLVATKNMVEVNALTALLKCELHMKDLGAAKKTSHC